MSTWTLSVRAGRRHHQIIGTSATDALAGVDALRAIGSLNAATGFERPRYDITIGGQLVVMVQTGEDHLGLPDHRGVADLLRHLEHHGDDPLPPR